MTEKNKNPDNDTPPAGSILQGLLEEAGFESQLRRFSVFEDWSELVGPQLAAHSQPWRMRGEVLEVRVDHAVWMQQLQLRKSEILRRINARLDNDPIRDLFWCFGTILPAEEVSPQDTEQLPESPSDPD